MKFKTALNIIISLFISLIFLTKTSYAIEQIKSFNVDILVEQNSDFIVTETISYDFGTDQRHGIFRYIPRKFKGKDNKQYQFDITPISIKDETGKPYNFKTIINSGKIEFKIGDADKFVTGLKTYVIKYRVSKGFRYFNDRDEIYWNATGNDWLVPINSSRVTINFEPAIKNNKDFKILDLSCYTGVLGSTSKDCSSFNLKSGARFTTTKPLNVKEGITISLSIPKNIVAVNQPSIIKTSLSDYIFYFVFIIMFSTPFLVFFSVIIKGIKIKLRMDRLKKDSIRQYEPPKYKNEKWLSPLETNFILTSKVTGAGLTSEIINLGVKKYIKIVKEDNDYKLILQQPYNQIRQNLELTEDNVLKMLSLDYNQEVKIKELTNFVLLKSYSSVISSQVNGNLKKDLNIEDIKHKVAFNFNGFEYDKAHETKEWGELQGRAFGLQKFIEAIDEKMEFYETEEVMFEKLLPYAIALGVADVWFKRFDHLNKLVDWYPNERLDHNNFTLLTRTINSSNIARSINYNSGRSGFGGGGSSGGGSGGGGGGSW